MARNADKPDLVEMLVEIAKPKKADRVTLHEGLYKMNATELLILYNALIKRTVKVKPFQHEE